MHTTSILDGIGNTPLIHLNALPQARDYSIVAKAEYLNAGGSIKSRTALGMLRDAREAGLIFKGDTIVEVSSGNEGIALAMLGSLLGYKSLIVMPDDVPPERKALIERYGGTVVSIPARETIAKTLDACFNRAEWLAGLPGYYYARQFENPSNAGIHEQTTGLELLAQTPGEIAAFVAGVGTGGTLTGVARAIRQRYSEAYIVAVEPEKAPAITGGEVSTHRQFGIGEGFIPPLLDVSLIDETIAVSDRDAYAMCHALALHEGLMVGPTSGTNVFAAIAVARKLGAGKIVATVLPDTAERYLSMPEFGNT